MATNLTWENYQIIQAQSVEDDKTVNKISDILKKEYITYFPAEIKNDYTEDYDKILNMTSITIKQYANSSYKSTTYLEPSDIEHIKANLSNFKEQQEPIKKFKTELIKDLTCFQRQIEVTYHQRISDLGKENSFFEKQMRILDLEKHKLIMDRLSRIIWPYDSTINEYDRKISILEIKIKRNKTKIEEMKSMRPSANAKEVLLFIMQLKEKYSQNN